MNATRAAALPAHRTEYDPCPRPKLHVVYRAEGSRRSSRLLPSRRP